MNPLVQIAYYVEVDGEYKVTLNSANEAVAARQQMYNVLRKIRRARGKGEDELEMYRKVMNLTFLVQGSTVIVRNKLSYTGTGQEVFGEVLKDLEDKQLNHAQGFGMHQMSMEQMYEHVANNPLPPEYQTLANEIKKDLGQARMDDGDAANDAIKNALNQHFQKIDYKRPDNTKEKTDPTDVEKTNAVHRTDNEPVDILKDYIPTGFGKFKRADELDEQNDE